MARGDGRLLGEAVCQCVGADAGYDLQARPPGGRGAMHHLGFEQRLFPTGLDSIVEERSCRGQFTCRHRDVEQRQQANGQGSAQSGGFGLDMTNEPMRRLEFRRLVAAEEETTVDLSQVPLVDEREEAFLERERVPLDGADELLPCVGRNRKTIGDRSGQRRHLGGRQRGHVDNGKRHQLAWPRSATATDEYDLQPD